MSQAIWSASLPESAATDAPTSRNRPPAMHKERISNAVSVSEGGSWSCAACAGLVAVFVAVVIGAVIWEPCPDLAGLQGKHVLITGASTGIGRQLALRYAQLGAKLTIAARRESKLQEVRALGLQAGSPGITVVRSDMGEAEDAESLASKAVAANGEIDVLVLNHALIDDSLVLEYTSEAALQRHVLAPMRVNFEGSVRLALSALPSLERSSGRIVVVSSGGWLGIRCRCGAFVSLPSRIACCGLSTALPRWSSSWWLFASVQALPRPRRISMRATPPPRAPFTASSTP